MFVAVDCPKCHTASDADKDQMGTIITCGECGESMAVPQPFIGPNVTLGGFKLIRRLGMGGMGEVYMAYQVSMERHVAIKILPRDMTRNEDAVARFLHEARMSARLEHPNIVTIIDAGEDCGFYFIAMRLVEGQNLQELLHRHKRVSELRALTYGFEILKALDFAWRHHKVFHRDVKPSNIMIDDESVKLLDMGLAKEALVDKSMTDPGMVMGTPLYMSPEQVRGDNDLDFRSDVYSLGATLFHLLTGAPMFDGDTVMVIMAHHLKTPTPNPSEWNPDVSNETSELILRMTAKRREERCADYAELLSAFERRIVELDPGASRRLGIYTSTTPSQPSAIRRRVSRSLAVAIPVMLAILAIGFSLGRHSAPPSSPPDPDGDDTTQIDDADPSEPAMDEATVRTRLEVVDLLEADPHELRSAVELLKALADDTRHTPWYDEIDARLDRLQRRYASTIDERSFVIRRYAWELFLKSDRDDAVSYLTDYAGEMAVETAAMRAKLAKEFQSRILEDARRKQKLEKELAALRKVQAENYKNALAEVRITIAEALKKKRFDAALASYKQFLERTDVTDFRLSTRREFEGIAKLADSQQGILESFRPQIGLRTTVALKEGKSVIIPVKIEPGVLLADEYLQTGPEGFKRRELRLRPTDFTIYEQAARLPKKPWSVYSVMVALLHVDAGKPDRAIYLLAKSDLPVARVIRRRLVRPLDEAWGDLVVAAKLDATTPGAILKAMETSTFEPGMRARLRIKARRFLNEWSRTPDALAYLATVRFLATAATIAVPSDLKDDTRPLFVDLTCLDAEGDGGMALQKRWQIATGLPRWAVTRKSAIPMALVPPGSFEMGSQDGEADNDFSNERPRHRVTLTRPFYVGRMEISQAQWKRVVGKLPPNEVIGKMDMPVGNVTWFEAKNFVNRLCNLEGVPQGTYRLLTEAEWEYAARAGTSGTFAGTRDMLCWHYANSASSPLADGAWDPDRWKAKDGETKPIASKKPNGWGIYDCHGNLMEWCQDWYGAYDVGWLLDPDGVQSGKMKVSRGGARHLPASACRSAARVGLPPKSRDPAIGLRIMRTIDVPDPAVPLNAAP